MVMMFYILNQDFKVFLHPSLHFPMLLSMQISFPNFIPSLHFLLFPKLVLHCLQKLFQDHHSGTYHQEQDFHSISHI